MKNKPKNLYCLLMQIKSTVFTLPLGSDWAVTNRDRPLRRFTLGRMGQASSSMPECKPSFRGPDEAQPGRGAARVGSLVLAFTSPGRATSTGFPRQVLLLNLYFSTERLCPLPFLGSIWQGWEWRKIFSFWCWGSLTRARNGDSRLHTWWPVVLPKWWVMVKTKSHIRHILPIDLSILIWSPIFPYVNTTSIGGSHRSWVSLLLSQNVEPHHNGYILQRLYNL